MGGEPWLAEVSVGPGPVARPTPPGLVCWPACLLPMPHSGAQGTCPPWPAPPGARSEVDKRRGQAREPPHNHVPLRLRNSVRVTVPGESEITVDGAGEGRSRSRHTELLMSPEPRPGTSDPHASARRGRRNIQETDAAGRQDSAGADCSSLCSLLFSHRPTRVGTTHVCVQNLRATGSRQQDSRDLYVLV